MPKQHQSNKVQNDNEIVDVEHLEVLVEAEVTVGVLDLFAW
jgi:hypothetical protein